MSPKKLDPFILDKEESAYWYSQFINTADVLDDKLKEIERLRKALTDICEAEDGITLADHSILSLKTAREALTYGK